MSADETRPDADLSMFRITGILTLWCGMCAEDRLEITGGTLRYATVVARNHLAAHNELARGGSSGRSGPDRPGQLPQ